VRTDVVVIGAGMAGVAAARECARAGHDVVVVEATDRVGGRIHTDRDLCDIPVELGAEFIHTDAADTLVEIEPAGLHLLRCNPADGFDMRIAGLRSADVYAHPSMARIGDLLGDVERWDGPDCTAEELLRARGVEGPARALAEQMLCLHPLGDPHEVSVVGLRDDRVVELERGVDHRVTEGYDALPTAMAIGLDVRFGFDVATVHWTADSVRVVAATGEELTAAAAVCTLPVGVLRSGAIGFEPDLPAAKWRALSFLEMGAVAKVVVRFTERFWDEDLTMLGCDGPVRLWWPPGYGRGADAPPVLTAYVTGARARALSPLSDADAARIALADLDRLFPEVTPSRLAEETRRVDWCVNPRARGGYSFVRLGGAGARAALAAADTGAIHWAGDATTTTTIAAVVHGAYASGVRAAAEVAAG